MAVREGKWKCPGCATVNRGRDVHCTSRDKGNGLFEDVFEDRPVYKTETYTEHEPVLARQPVHATKYTYELDKWSHDRDVTAEGVGATEPRWPAVDLAGAGGKKLQEGKRTESYEVRFTPVKGGDAVSYRPTTAEDFARFAPGALLWKGKVRGTEVSELVPVDLPAESPRGK